MAKAKYSPCIKICTMNEDLPVPYCLGCYRTDEEIRGWRDRTEEEQLAGITMLKQRQMAEEIKYDR
jgi:predicted Fe-S protein YdhL (DUF1289 family)